MLILSLGNHKAVLKISYECIRNNRYMIWQLVPLNVPVVEGVIDKYSVVLGRIREVRPAEAWRVVMFLLHYLENSLVLLSLIRLICIDGLDEDVVSLLSDYFEEMVLLHHVVDHEVSWLHIAIDLSSKIFSHCTEDPHFSVVVLASHHVEMFSFADSSM